MKKAVQEIRETVGGHKCIVALSGGGDSNTATALAAKAIGRRLTAVFIVVGGCVGDSRKAILSEEFTKITPISTRSYGVLYNVHA